MEKDITGIVVEISRMAIDIDWIKNELIIARNTRDILLVVQQVTTAIEKHIEDQGKLNAILLSRVGDVEKTVSNMEIIVGTHSKNIERMQTNDTISMSAQSRSIFMSTYGKLISGAIAAGVLILAFISYVYKLPNMK